MALDNFKRTDIIVDKIDRSLDEITPLKAQQGEYNGRYLRVQLTNGGIIEPQTADVQFGFRHNDNANNGIVVAKKTDPSKGIYDIYYPTEMTREAGVVICQLKIIETTGSQKKEISLTSDFKVTVVRSIITGQMEVAENSITVFDKVLLDIKEHERRVILLETAFGDLYKILNTNIPNMDAKVSSRASQSSLNDFKSRTDNYLNATITSRASASTALSNNIWTNTLATTLVNKSKPRVLKSTDSNAYISNSLTNVLNIVGAGYLTSAIFGNPASAYYSTSLEIKIVIDGRTFFHVYSNGANAMFTIKTDGTRAPTSQEELSPSPSRQPLHDKGNHGRRGHGSFSEPIYFNNSLQVYVQNKPNSGGSGYDYNGFYTLTYEVVV